jgi:hypothetical protein
MFCSPERPLLPRRPVVLEKVQRQRQRHRLGQDREIHAGHAAAERQPAEHQRQQPGHQHHKRQLRDQAVGEIPDHWNLGEPPTTPKICVPMASRDLFRRWRQLPAGDSDE